MRRVYRVIVLVWISIFTLVSSQSSNKRVYPFYIDNGEGKQCQVGLRSKLGLTTILKPFRQYYNLSRGQSYFTITLNQSDPSVYVDLTCNGENAEPYHGYLITRKFIASLLFIIIPHMDV